MCFFLSFFIGLPLLAVKPRKFAVRSRSFTLRRVIQLIRVPRFHSLWAACVPNVQLSHNRVLRMMQILFMAGFALLQGPVAHLKHILTAERIPFTIAYFGSLALTLFFALVVSRDTCPRHHRLRLTTSVNRGDHTCQL